MRTDPTDNGGLFIGRRPGTAPVRYRIAPVRRLGLRLTFDKVFAASILALMLLVAILFWGPIPAAWLWIGGQVKHVTASGGLSIVFSSLGILATLHLALALLHRLDQFWILVRRAAGYDQRTAMIRTLLFTSW